MEYIKLTGADDVYRAGTNILSASENIRQSVNMIEQAVYEFGLKVEKLIAMVNVIEEMKGEK